VQLAFSWLSAGLKLRTLARTLQDNKKPHAFAAHMMSYVEILGAAKCVRRTRKLPWGSPISARFAETLMKLAGKGHLTYRRASPRSSYIVIFSAGFRRITVNVWIIFMMRRTAVAKRKGLSLCWEAVKALEQLGPQ